MPDSSRTKKSIVNSISGMFSYIFVMIATMATRIAFARFLGEELLGLNSLYTSILQILQITELGISNAIIIFLYEPIKNSNQQKTKALINLYKKVYNAFAATLLILGLMAQFFIIPHIVDVKTIEMSTVQIYFFLFLMGIVCSYLFAYNKSILYAEQKNNIISLVNAVQKVIVSVLQVVAIFMLHNYFCFLILMIVGYLVENLICHFWVLKRHPYLKEKQYEKLSKTEKQEIINLIKPIFVVRIADKVLGQSDSLIINQYIDIITLGMYTNYHTIFNACIGLFNPIGASLTSSYGNLSVDANSERKYAAYKKSYSPLHFIAVEFCALFLAFIQDFTYIAYGERYLLSNSVCVFMTIYLYLTFVKTIYYSYQNAMGLHRLDQKQTVMQVPFNIVVSILLAMKMGLNGVIIGTILSILIFSIGFKGKYLYEHAFEVNVKVYYIKVLKNFVLTAIDFIIIYYISNYFVTKSIVAFLIKVILISIFSTIIVCGMHMCDKEFRTFILSIIKGVRKLK